jgi:hypothetical protein
MGAREVDLAAFAVGRGQSKTPAGSLRYAGLARFCVVARLDFGSGVINDPIRLQECESCAACLKLLKI